MVETLFSMNLFHSWFVPPILEQGSLGVRETHWVILQYLPFQRGSYTCDQLGQQQGWEQFQSWDGQAVNRCDSGLYCNEFHIYTGFTLRPHIDNSGICRGRSITKAYESCRLRRWRHTATGTVVLQLSWHPSTRLEVDSKCPNEVHKEVHPNSALLHKVVGRKRWKEWSQQKWSQVDRRILLRYWLHSSWWAQIFCSLNYISKVKLKLIVGNIPLNTQVLAYPLLLPCLHTK